MSTQHVKILIRRGLRSEVTTSILEKGEMGFATDTNQLFIGTDPAFNEIQFDPFANAHAIVQHWLDSDDNPEPGLIIDEDLVIRDVVDAEALLTAMTNSSEFHIDYARQKGYVEIVTENTFNQLFADQHLSSVESATGIRPSLFRKSLKQRIHGPDKLEFGREYKILEVGTNTDAQLNWNTVAGTNGVTYAVDDTFTSVDQVAMETGQGSALTTQGTFLKYNKGVCTSFFVDYSLKQYYGDVTYIRVGQLKIVNGYPLDVEQAKLTDDNTEIWQDDSNGIADVEEFSNIEFYTTVNGDNLEINFTQNENFTTEVSYTVKRWSM